MLFEYSKILKYIPIINLIYIFRFPILLLKKRIDYSDYYIAQIKVSFLAIPAALILFFATKFFSSWVIEFLIGVLLLYFCVVCASIIYLSVETKSTK